MSATFRIIEHQQAVTFSKNEDFYNAVIVLQNALEKFGPHVGLISDLVANLYLMGRFFESHKVFKLLITEFKTSQDLLSIKSKINTLIFISKMHEEFGEIEQAIISLNEILNIPLLTPNQHIRSYSNLLRICSEFSDNNKLNEIYLSSSIKNISNETLLFEVEHSNILAELNLFGFDITKNKIIKILNLPSLNISQKKLLLFDIVEFCFNRNIENEFKALLINTVKDIELTKYEMNFINIISNNDIDINITDCLDDFSNGILNTLRLYRLLKFKLSDEYYLQYNKKINFILNSLSNKNKILINKWLQIPKFKNKLSNAIFIFSYKNENIYLNNSKLNFSSDTLFIYLLNKFKNSTTLQIEIISEEFYKEIFTVNHIDRFRVALNRLNIRIKKNIGLDQVWIFKKNVVEVINEKVKFE